MGDAYTYTYHDISRYLNKEMTVEEMHAFEKAMMDDPFLADALEGFEKSNPSRTARDLAFIEKKVKGEAVEEKGSIVIKQKSTAWWRIAALFIVLAGTAIFFFKINNKATNQAEIAQNKPTQVEETPADTIRPLEKTSAPPELFGRKHLPERKSNTAAPPVTQNQTLRAPAPAAVMIYDSTAASPQKDHDAVVASLSKTIRPPAATMARELSKSFESNNSQHEFTGRVLGNNQKPLPYASVKADSNLAVVTDQNGDFTIRATDSVLRVTVSSAGFVSASRQIKSNAPDNRIILKEADQMRDEVVVGYGSAKKEKATPLNDQPAVSGNFSVNDAEPEGGWQSFRDYVSGNLKKQRDTDNTFIGGDVLVQFNIDEKGRPRDVMVSLPVNKETAKRAVRLIEEGPRWKSKTGATKAKVLIKL